MKLYIKRDGYYLVPADQESLKIIKKLSKDITYEVNLRQYRNILLHRKFFAMVKIGYDNTEIDMPFDAYRKYMIIKAGYYDAYHTGKGVMIEAKSISFGSMSEEEFKDVYTRVRTKVAEDIAITDEELEKQVLMEF